MLPRKQAALILILAVMLEIGDTSAYWLKRREKIIALATDNGPLYFPIRCGLILPAITKI